MNVVDSSAWLEYFADGPNAGEFAEAIADTERLLVPGITLFEVFKRVRLQRDPAAALYAVAQMTRGRVVNLDAELAVAAAALSAETGLAMEEETVGGPIDVAIISKGDGFIWIKRKHYFDGLLNRDYLSRQSLRPVIERELSRRCAERLLVPCQDACALCYRSSVFVLR